VYVRQTLQYLLKYIKNETVITRQVLELQFKYERFVLNLLEPEFYI